MGDELSPRDVGLALLLGAAATALYLLTPQARVYGDGIWIVQFLPPHEGGVPFHPFFGTCYSGVKALWPDLHVVAAARRVSQLSAGAAVGFTYLVARGFVASRPAAVLAALLFALSPVTWFFGTQVEFHALYVGWVAAAAAVCLHGPWRRSPTLALLCSALLLVPTCLAHEIIAILGPGWVLLVQHARRRAGAGAYTVRGLLLGVGPVLVAALVLALCLENLLHGAAADLDVSDEVGVLGRFLNWGFTLDELVDGLIRPVSLLLLAGLLGLLTLRRDRTALAALAVLIGVPVTFLLTIYNCTERGGFMLGPAPFLAAGAAALLAAGARRFGTKRTVAGGLLLVSTQAGLAWHYRGTFDYGFDPEVRAQRVREVLGDEGTRILLVGHPLAPTIELYLPDVEQRSLERHAIAALERKAPPERILETLRLARLDPEKIRVAIDLNYPKVPDLEEFGTFPEFFERIRVGLAPYYAAFAAYVDREFETTLFDDPYWPMLRIDRRRTP